MLKHLAAQGRSVFVSSHLLAEMALLADALVVIGRGRLLASGPVEDFISDGAVVVRTPDPGRLVGLLRQHGGTADEGRDGALTVSGLAPDTIGDLAFDAGIRLHELAPRSATLEEAFLAATGQSEEFVAR
jgi:ABC-2 type transport system ATP-binding protein